MKLRVMSDLHLEFHADHGAAFVAALPDCDSDAIVLAGDIGVTSTLFETLRVLCERFAPKPVLFVAGNHDHWGPPGRFNETMRRAQDRIPNLRHLDRCVDVFGDIDIAGATLWHQGPPIDADAARIFNAAKFIRSSDELHRRFFELVAGSAGLNGCARELVAVSHHLPHPQSIHPKYAAMNNGPFCNFAAANIVESCHYAVWIHGHTHESCDYIAPGGTRVVCNPYGYHGYEINPGWEPLKVVEVRT